MTAELPEIEWVVVEPWGRLGVRMLAGMAFVHCQIQRWSPTLKRSCLDRWSDFKALMRGRGIVKLYSMVPGDDAKLCKWQVLFGMQHIASMQGQRLYTQEI